MNVAIVVAAGKGTRLGGDRPKQFLQLGGIPIIIHALKQFERCKQIDEVIAVLPADETAGFQSLISRHKLRRLSQVIAGGETRAQSVQHGLTAISHADIVAVHDGVRPFVTPDEIDRVTSAAERNGAAVLVAAVADTIKEVDDGRVLSTLPRSSLRRALTPQCFRYDLLQRAYGVLGDLEAKGIKVTDDSFLVERLGVEVFAVEGGARNIKITQPEDLALAEALLKAF